MEYVMRYEAMRLLCFFDLPMETNQEKRTYRNFRKELIANGFEMLQFSVYYRTCPNRSFASKFETKQFTKWQCPFTSCYRKAIFRNGLDYRREDQARRSNK